MNYEHGYFNPAMMLNEEDEEPSCDLPYPPPMMKEGVWEDGCESMAREQEITEEYIEGYGIPKESSILYFIRTYEGNNEAVENLKKIVEDFYEEGEAGIMFDDIYETMRGILKNPFDKEAIKRSGLWIVKKYEERHMEVMMMSNYLICWYMKSSNNMCIASYGRVQEYYWDGVGNWLA